MILNIFNNNYVVKNTIRGSEFRGYKKKFRNKTIAYETHLGVFGSDNEELIYKKFDGDVCIEAAELMLREVEMNLTYQHVLLISDIPKNLFSVSCPRGIVVNDDGVVSGVVHSYIPEVEKISERIRLLNYEGKEEEAIAIIRRALEFMHFENAVGLVHNDFHWGNLLVNKKDDLFVIDFADSKVVEKGSAFSDWKRFAKKVSKAHVRYTEEEILVIARDSVPREYSDIDPDALSKLNEEFNEFKQLLKNNL